MCAHNSSAPGHAAARRWWESSLSGREAVGLVWTVMLGYIRLVTSRSVLVDPSTASEAIGHVRSWLDRPQTQVIQPGARHLDLLETLAAEAGGAGRLTTDVHLAAPRHRVSGDLVQQ